MTLADIRKSIADVDAKRAMKRLTEEQREALEMTAVGLREAERIAIAKKQKKALAEMEDLTADVNKLSKEIRERMKKMNAFPKGVVKVEAVLSAAVKLLIAAARGERPHHGRATLFIRRLRSDLMIRGTSSTSTLLVSRPNAPGTLVSRIDNVPYAFIMNLSRRVKVFS